MQCPFCRQSDSRVIDSRTADDGSSIRRRRECPNCGKRFSTLETASVSVVKRSGAVEPFRRDKVAQGVAKACQGRPVTEGQIAFLVSKVEEVIRSSGQAEISSDDIGRAILPPLREIDEVAYLRFASVVRAFVGLDDFEQEIARLRRDDADKAAEMSAETETTEP